MRILNTVARAMAYSRDLTKGKFARAPLAREAVRVAAAAGSIGAAYFAYTKLSQLRASPGLTSSVTLSKPNLIPPHTNRTDLKKLIDNAIESGELGYADLQIILESATQLSIQDLIDYQKVTYRKFHNRAEKDVDMIVFRYYSDETWREFTGYYGEMSTLFTKAIMGRVPEIVYDSELSDQDLYGIFDNAIEDGYEKEALMLIAEGSDTLIQLTPHLPRALGKFGNCNSPKLVGRLIGLLDDKSMNSSVSDSFGEALENAAFPSNFETFDLLVGSSAFMHISPEHIGRALGKAATREAVKIAERLVSSGRFQEIPVDCLGKALRGAAETGGLDMIRFLVDPKNRFLEIPRDYLPQALETIAESTYRQQREAASLILNSVRSPEFKEEDFERVMGVAAQHYFCSESFKQAIAERKAKK